MQLKTRLVEPFYFPGNHIGCLLIHGFSGSPSEMRLLGERLAKSGWTVLGIQLSGHGAASGQIAKFGWQDWVNDAEASVSGLRKSCSHIIAIGLSLGGLLALHLAAQGLVDGIVSMNSPMLLTHEAEHRDQERRLSSEYLEKAVAPKFERSGYVRLSPEALISLNQGICQVRGRLPKITCPVLLMQSRIDSMVDPISAEIIAKNICSQTEVVYWEHSGHILSLGPERELAADKICEFIRESDLKK